MKRKLTSIILFFSLAMVCLVQTGCYGQFALVRKIYTWNGEVAGNDQEGVAIKSLVQLPLLIVYPFAVFVDLVFLNTLEFWTGENPVAMEEGEMDQQIIRYAGTDYRVTATKNKFHVAELKGTEVVKEAEFVYDPKAMTWTAVADGEAHTLITIERFSQDRVVLTAGTGDLAQTFHLNRAALDTPTQVATK